MAPIDPAFAAAGAVTGALIGLTGVGGGALMTPVLLLVFGVPPVTAVATDLWFAAITKIAAARMHGGKGRVDWQVARRLWTGSLPVAAVVVALVSSGARIGHLDWLAKVIGAVVVLTAAGLLLAPRLFALGRRRRLTDALHFKAVQPALTVVAGVLLGVCVALTSIGAGALGSVALLYLYPLRMNPLRLVATDIVHAIPLALLAGLGYLWAGWVDGRMLLSLLAGSIPAVVLGSLLAGRVPARWLQLALAMVLLAAGVKSMS